MAKKANGRTSKLRQLERLPQFLLKVNHRFHSDKKRYHRQSPARYIVIKWAPAPKSGKGRKMIIPLFIKDLELSIYHKSQSAKSPLQYKLPLGRRWLVLSAAAKTARKVGRGRIRIISFKLAHLASATMVIVGLIGSSYFGWQVFADARSRSPVNIGVPSVPAMVNVRPRVTPSPPSNLTIAKIGVNSSLVELGQQPDQTIEVPKEYDIPGWYKLAPTPGEIGPAIIVGHYDSYRGPAVFYRLKELRPGDTIDIKRLDGKLVQFAVTAVKQVPQNNFPTEEVYGNIDYPGLRLITCAGNFNRSSLSYTDNLIVFAKAL